VTSEDGSMIAKHDMPSIQIQVSVKLVGPLTLVAEAEDPCLGVALVAVRAGAGGDRVTDGGCVRLGGEREAEEWARWA